MTEAVLTKVEELKQTILNSEEHRNYDMYKRLLSQTPELKQKVDEFRAANFKMQTSDNSEDKNAIQEFAAQYNDILTNSVVREFLNAELILCRMMQQVNLMLAADLQLELDFL